MPLVCKWAKIMSETFLMVANHSNWASPEEIANRRKAIHNFIRARITDAATVDDLTQEVLVKAQRAGPSLKDSAKLEGWMFRIARNMVADHFRNSAKLVIFSSDGGSVVRPDIALFTQEQENRKAHLLRCVHAFVESLPDHYRTALELVDFEGISQVELAKRFGLTISAAKSRVQRARARLRALIDACCEVDTDVYGNFIDCRRRGDWLPCE
jgi:RNA polymerase sigma-70 factor (ECF subfamily)